jgi:hypothetical protein|tara:strand:+ start:1731 stop:1988 length:258 start_codon:yes stop_codon:yes gene_type:complete
MAQYNGMFFRKDPELKFGGIDTENDKPIILSARTGKPIEMIWDNNTGGISKGGSRIQIFSGVVMRMYVPQTQKKKVAVYKLCYAS